MSRSNMNCQAVSITLKIMFYRVFFCVSNLYIAGNVCSRRYMNRQRIWLVALHRFSFLLQPPTLFFCAFSEISCFWDVKTLAIIITSGNETLKVLGFKGTRFFLCSEN